MAAGGTDDAARLAAETQARLEMERISGELSNLIRDQPAQQFLGYVWSKFLLRSMPESAEGRDEDKGDIGREISTELIQLVLEYAHATFASYNPSENAALDESACEQIFELADRLRIATFQYCMASSTRAESSEVFGPQTGEFEFITKSNWVLIRGTRYQVLESEFFSFVLEPHNDALRAAYGLDGKEIADQFQAIADSMRAGHMRALEEIQRRMAEVTAIGAEIGIDFEAAFNEWLGREPVGSAAAKEAVADLFAGGICNLTKHTSMPDNLLQDLGYERGENTEFFATGNLSGTPLRTLPARIKPLVHLDDGFYAPDPSFVRDAGYRAVQRGLLKRDPSYRQAWNENQRAMTEGAFRRIFEEHLQDAVVLPGIFYPDAATGQWAESDGLILLDDVLILIEAKAGVAAMDSPADNFDRHIRAIRNLVVNAYEQLQRFLLYLESAPAVPVFELRDGNYVEVRRIRLADYNLVLPIGLTIESFSPFSTNAKQIPAIVPILDRHPFISISIDELFVLKRILMKPDELFHYLEVRQAVAGIRNTRLFDEFDHLGAYIAKNRFDIDLREQLDQGTDFVAWDGFSESIDQYFEGDRWLNEPPPHQEFPAVMEALLKALRTTRAPGWLRACRFLRDFSSSGREDVSAKLQEALEKLHSSTSGAILVAEREPLYVWLQRAGVPIDQSRFQFRAKSAALACERAYISGIVAFVTQDGQFIRATSASISAPSVLDAEWVELEKSATSLREKIEQSLRTKPSKKSGN